MWFTPADDMSALIIMSQDDQKVKINTRRNVDYNIQKMQRKCEWHICEGHGGPYVLPFILNDNLESRKAENVSLLLTTPMGVDNGRH